MKNKSKLIGDKQFYKMVMTISVPIMVQNLITNFVSLLDNFMVGRLGTEQMSGVAIANQILLVVNLAIFGLLSGIGIYGAQFYGKGNVDGIRCSLRFKIYVSIGVTAAFIAVLLLWRDGIISLFLHDEDSGNIEQTMTEATSYLMIMLIGLIPCSLGQTFATTLRETGDTKTPMIAGFAAVGTNVVFNYILIFGKLGAPAMGVRGAAIATVMSRFVEMGILIIYAVAKRERFPYMKGLFSGFGIPKEYIGNFAAKGGSLMTNEILWSGSQTALSIAYSLHGLDVVAGYSVSSTVINLFFISCAALGVSTGIIVGNELGAGNHEKAITYARQMLFFSVTSCVLMSLLLALLGGQIPKLYNINDTAKGLATYFICISAIFMPADAFCNNCYFTLRSGGKTGVTVIFDSGSLWLLSVPVSFALFYLFHLDIHIVYPIVVSLQIVKAIVGYFLLRSKMWVNTIV